MPRPFRLPRRGRGAAPSCVRGEAIGMTKISAFDRGSRAPNIRLVRRLAAAAFSR